MKILEQKPGMEFELTADEARRLSDHVCHMLAFMSRLEANLERKKGRYQKLRPIVSKAQDALQHLSVHLHYEEYGGGAKPLRVRPPA